MNEHETIADIIAEKRRRADELEASSYRPHQFLRERIAELRQEADRLEAAHRRECGDCAKLREAVKAISGLCDRLIPTWDGAIGRIKDIAEAALAAPPRNCDVYNNESCRMAYHLHGDGLMTMQAFADWLFAPATEQKGGAK